jgi:hypothetical protein
MTLPFEVQQAIHQAVIATEWPLGNVPKALIIAASQPNRRAQWRMR